MDLNGKNVVYLGGFGGIGRNALKEFLNKKVQNLAIFDLSENAEIMGDLKSNFGSAEIRFFKMDITKTSDIEAAYKEAVEWMGHIDVVINGCGLINDRLIDLTIQINLLGLIHSTLIALSYMDKSRGGRGGLIVNISSVAGIQPAAYIAVYTAAKFGVTAFTRSLSDRLYYERTGVALSIVCPGLTDTPLLDDPANRSTLDFPSPITERINKVQRQTPESCAKNLVKVAEAAKNGAVWLLDLGEMKELTFPVMWTPPLKP